jgi:hypothetical protein
MEIVDLLANVGGILGLFMGVSVLSLCEILEALIEMCSLLKIKFCIKTVSKKIIKSKGHLTIKPTPSVTLTLAKSKANVTL